MNPPPPSLLIGLFASGLFLAGSCMAEPAPVSHFYDEAGQRYLTLRSTSTSGVEVGIRWAADPGSTAAWMGQGTRKDNQVVFAALVDEGQDRGSYFIAKGGESKMEISFRPGQKMPQDPGILGIYRRVSDEKRLQLARKEFQAADDRLNAALKTASRMWPGGGQTGGGGLEDRLACASEPLDEDCLSGSGAGEGEVESAFCFGQRRRPA